MAMTYYRQGDPRWSLVRIGPSKLTVGGFGCVLTDVCMLLSWWGVIITPGQMARMPGLFNYAGEILWGELERVTKGKLKFVQRIGKPSWKRDDKAIRASILGSPKTVVIIQVQNGRHWVAGLGVTPDKKDYIVADPIDGKRKQLFKTYSNITGSAHLLLN